MSGRGGFATVRWLRRIDSGEDVAGRSGHQARQVDADELRAHAREDDAWLAIRGEVYDVTPYIPYHPVRFAFVELMRRHRKITM